MPTRSITRRSTPVGAATGDAAPIYVDSDDNKLKMIPAGSGTTEVDIADVSSTQTLTNKTFTAPTLTTPNIGVATATSVNKITITAPATGATLTLVEGGSLITAGAYAITLTATATTGVTLPTTGTLATLAGTEALTNKTLTTPVINNPAGATSTGVMITKRVLFTENATNTVHTGTVAVPAGAWIHDIQVTNQALWGAASAALDVGDTADPNGFFAAVDCKATDLLVGEVLSMQNDSMWGGKEGAYIVAATGRRGPVSTNFGLYYADGTNILGTMTVGTPGATTGRTIMSVTYSVGEALAAVATGP